LRQAIEWIRRGRGRLPVYLPAGIFSMLPNTPWIGDSVGATGGWECLFRLRTPEAMSERVAARAVDMLAAGYPEGGRKKVLLSPQIVGLLTHEAIGHTVEADFVRSGSVAAGKLGQRVASELVTLCDSGASEHYAGAGGTLFVDDEGVPARRTEILRDGVLVSYLHDRESAAELGVAPTGNARAWEYDDEPLIRMRNTYIEPGDKSLEELSRLCNPTLRGWINYYGQYYKTALYWTFNVFNRILTRWAMRKKAWTPWEKHIPN